MHDNVVVLVVSSWKTYSLFNKGLRHAMH
jgi:hypothetical protein